MRNINVWLPLACPLLETWPTTQACALTGNWTGNPLVLRPALNHWATPAGAKFFVLFGALPECVFLPCLPNHWFSPLLHPTSCLLLPVCYLSQIRHSFFLTGPFFMVSTSFFMLLSILINIILNSLTNCLSPFHLALLENSLVLSFGVCFFVFPFWLILCIFHLRR